MPTSPAPKKHAWKFALAALLFALGLAACDSGAPAVELNIGQPAPGFQTFAVDGAPVDFPAAFLGKPLVIRFWADWCRYCEGEMTAIEIDRDLVPILREESQAHGRLTLVEADVLTVNFTELAAGQRIRVAGNLPYNISTPVLFHLLDHAEVIEDMHFMLQREVVERMAAPHGDKVYGRLSVALQARCKVEKLFRVMPGSFWPVPKVESAIVRLTPLHDPQRTALAEPLDRILRAAFAQRRKTLSNALAGVLDAVTIASCGVRPEARAEQVDVAGFLKLASALR